MPLWQALLARRAEAVVPMVEVGRWDAAAVKSWARDTELAVGDAAEQADLLAVTGGWAVLVDRMVEVATDRGRTAGLDAVRHDLADPTGVRRFVDAVGLTGHPRLCAAFNNLCDLLGDEAESAEDLIAVLASEGNRDAAHDLDVLRMLGVLEATQQGFLRPEPVFAAAWQAVTAAKK